MRKITFLTLAASTLLIYFPAGATPLFSIDPASPSIDGNITPDDVLAPGPEVFIQGRDLGLQDSFSTGIFDDLDALSFGQDPIHNPLFFSVDRVAIGRPGTDVFLQAQPGMEEAHGDVYMSLPPSGSNRLVIDEEDLRLVEGFFGDDLNGLELDTNPPPVYFSIDFLSASNGTGAGILANDIFINKFPFIYAVGESDIGLHPQDDLDALALDAAANRALFSLSPFSPSTFTFTGLSYSTCIPGHMSPADICLTDFAGGFGPWAAAGDIGLLSDDNVDALDTQAVPEPGTVLLLGSGLVGLWVFRRRRHARAD